MAGSAPGISAKSVPSLEEMSGEAYRYSLDFLLFRNLAEGELRLSPEPQSGRYRAELIARTLNVAAWLTGERTQRYVAIMEEVAGQGMRSVSYESAILKRKNRQWTDRRKRFRFDYQAGKVYYEKGEGDRFRLAAVYSLPPGQTPVDILTGFYNLRIGIYGALVPGARMRIPTFTTRGISTIDVEVLTGPARSARGFFPASGTLLRIRVDPEVFDTGGADLYAWLDAKGQPARGLVEDVIGMGDVFGRLREESSRD